MSNKSIVLAFVLFLLFLLGGQCLFVVKETERAIKLQFGEVVGFDIKPGLHFKIPFIQKVRRFDGRILTLDADPARFLTTGKKYVIVDSYIKWRIKNVRNYYTSTSGDRFQASNRLADLVNRGLRNEFGVRSLQEVVSGSRDELMINLTTSLTKETEKEFGIEVLDVRVKAIDLPEELSQDVYSRMRAEREREAREIRSEGKEQSEGIQARADRDYTVILANAYREAEQIRGEGDAKATAVYSKAYKQDPEFYSFTRSLKAYQETFKNKDILLLKPDSDFFKYMKTNSKTSVAR